MSKRRVVIIDDGVQRDEFGEELISRFCITHGSITCDKDDLHSGRHGTTVAKIIAKYSSDIDLISIRMLNSDGFGFSDDLVAALEWCLESRVYLINLSNGLELPSSTERLYSVCRKLALNGTIIVAAQSNRPLETYPAVFPTVISVEQMTLRESHNDLRTSNIYTTGRHLIKVGGIETYTEECNSYACAFASSYLLSIGNRIDLFSNKLLLFKYKPLFINAIVGTYEIPFLVAEQDKDLVLQDTVMGRGYADRFRLPAFEPVISFTKETRLGSLIRCIVKQGVRRPRTLLIERRYPWLAQVLLSCFSARIWMPPAIGRNKKTRGVESFVIWIKTPVIERKLLSTLQELVNLFRKGGYLPLCITGSFDGLSYGFVYTSYDSIDDVLIKYTHLIRPDVTIIATEHLCSNHDCRILYRSSSFEIESHTEFTATDSEGLFNSLISLYATEVTE